jgi:hypothetical protein
MGRLAQRWLGEDDGSAKMWFAQLPPDTRNRAIVSMCRGVKPHQAGRGDVAKLAFAISDKTVRDRALHEFARSFKTDDPVLAESVDDFPISDAEKAYLGRLITENANGR